MNAKDGNNGKEGGIFSKVLRLVSKYQRFILIAVALGLLAFMFIKSNPREVWENIKDINLRIILVVIGLYVINLATKAFRWWMLLRAGEEDRSRITYFGVFKAFTATMAINNVTPGRAGGEPVKIILADKAFGLNMGKGLATVFVEKSLDLFLILVLAIGGLVFLVVELPWEVSRVLIIALGLFIVLFTLILFTALYKEQLLFRRLFLWAVFVMRKTFGNNAANSTKLKGMKIIRHFSRGLLLLGKSKITLFFVFILTVIVWLNEALRLFLVLMALGVEINFGIVLIASSMATIVGMVIPFGLGHIVAIYWILSPMGVDEETSGVAAASFVLTSIWVCVPIGALIILLTGIKPKKVIEESKEK